ncbi:MAG: protein kinase domain-containing protein [Thermoguttaceae bacterium]
MGETGQPADEVRPGLPADRVEQRIDELCDEFEACWKRGERPAIEGFLGQVDAEHRGGLFSHLLAIEIYWRRRKGQLPTADEYGRVFPQHRELVDCQFQADGQRPSVPNAVAETLLLPSDRPTTRLPAASRSFGNYQLLEEIGRGGMGVVYRAWQPSANRYVALKLIRHDRLESLPSEHQSSVIHRFEHEAQAAGQIQHDHIVTVYEVGQFGGEHFFSMRYVEGRSLTDLLKEGPLDGRRAAAYLEPVARAVHEAHLHGILHRDLKPQNILIDARTDRALVVDFGLAKLAENAEAMTVAGDVMGTPPYMPPEQATDSSRVTAKSDVYSLGATLYHAVTGQPPFQASSVLETIRLVADQAPQAPRQIDPLIDRDLETICLKCLEKDPSRRYASAEVLADELQRFLRHEPIEARPLGPAGRTLRWCRRYPVVAALLCCTLVFFAVALAASFIGYVKTSAALAESERSDQQVRQTVDRFFTRVSEESLLNQSGMQPLRQELLQLAMEHYEQFVTERSDDPAVRDELAMNAYRLGSITEQLGSIDKAQAWYRKALEIQERLVAERPGDTQVREGLGDTLNAMGGICLSQRKIDEARTFYERTARERGQLVGLAPDNLEWQRKLANSYMNQGVVARESGDNDQARKRFVQAQQLRHRILDRDPQNAKTRRDLAMGCYNLANLQTSIEPLDADGATANLKEALGLFEELLTSQPNDLDHQYRTAVTARLYGDLLCHLGRADQAQQPYLRALDLMRHLAYLNPEVPEYRCEQARILMNLGVIPAGSTAEENAETASRFVEARSLLEDLAAEYPEEPKYTRDLAATLCAIANLSFRMGDRQSALQLVQEAKHCFEGLCERYPDQAEFRQLLDDVNQRQKAISEARVQPVSEGPSVGAKQDVP